MANLEVLALDTAVPQIRAPGAGDGYSVPRDMTMASGTTLAAQAVTSTSLGTTGNLTFSGTAQRITGDMSNATQSSRLLFQTSTTNGTTNIGAIPNGTGTTAQLLLANSSDPTNASRARFNVGPSEAQINIDLVGTGTNLPLTFHTGGSERMRLDTSGNLGLGVTPSAWFSASRVYQFGSGGALEGRTNESQYFALTANQYIDSAGAFKYIGSTFASRYQQYDGIHSWSTAPSGTAGNAITFTQAMTLDASGNLGIGTASPAHRLDVRSDISEASAYSAQLGINSVTKSAGNLARIMFNHDDHGSASIASDYESAGNGNLIFSTRGGGDPTERMRISASGNVGIGGTAEAYTKTGLYGTLPTNSAISIGFRNAATVPSGSTGGAYGYNNNLITQAASFTLSDYYHFFAYQNIIGAGSTVTNQYGYFADATLTGATNNFGFYSNIASGSNRWNFYAAGTAANYFAGDTGIGTTTIAAGARLHIVSSVASNEGILRVVHTSTGQNSGATFLNGNSTNGGRLAIDGIGGFNLVNGDNNYLLFGTNNTERMRIDSSGNVGIGTAPSYTLDVYRSGTNTSVIVARNDNSVAQLYSTSSSSFTGTSTNTPFGFITNNLERMRITATGNVVAGGSVALATNATDGFLYVPTCAGTPTGTPTAITGMAPIVVDTTNNKLYFYSGGQWRDAGP